MTSTQSEPLRVMSTYDVNTRSNMPEPNQQPISQKDATSHPTQKKKKEKLSSLCKTPPQLIRSRTGKDFYRGLFLGEGGFARCFQVKDDAGQIYAAKTVAKASLRSEKTKTKLLAEIKIHKSLKHQNIVDFVDCFEDDTNIYILLEICSNQSLMEMMRKRKRLTEPEVRYFIVQILGAVDYMHSRRVIHRDLKLGNIFLDVNMNIKIGDFGLAALLASDSDRKKTICGTPNYIAPEILFDKEKGHSYEVDIWSVGIIMYAMIFGKPPFQSKDVNTIYKRIKHLDYQFPVDMSCSDDAKDLIQILLSSQPEKRPSLNDIIKHPFFRGQFPYDLSSECINRVPKFPDFDPQISFENYKRNCKLAGLGTGQIVAGLQGSKKPVEILPSDIVAEKPRRMLPQSLSPASTKDKYKIIRMDPENIRKLAATQSITTGVDSIHRRLGSSTKELGKPQRIDSENLASRSHHQRLPQPSANHQQNIAPPISQRQSSSSGSRLPVQSNEYQPIRPAQQPMDNDISIVSEKITKELEQTCNTISYALSGHVLLPIKRPHADPVFICKWVDYSNKYGLAYTLLGGTVGVLFNDESTILMQPDNFHFNSIKKNLEKSQWDYQSFDDTITQPNLCRKVKLVRNFNQFMQENLCHVNESKISSKDDKIVWVTAYHRSDAGIMFHLSDSSYQFNFVDHCKMIIYNNGYNVNFIDPEKRLHSWDLMTAIEFGQRNVDPQTGLTKFGIIEKLEHVHSTLSYALMDMSSKMSEA
ncbi:Pkinase-domain-containing protein [Nadsonia fulvescens var. elongata DSM 6958]|uniref:Serine/threonine-protein kinase n=1 Tax=Nadsonia fulvescens var. elongata DSM 6958 TaxID=857566 RepID=A0A1E3PJ95_9ASCO|nr:Pkinase-domain-containing protein [Nadsonia fulvescens var. elongata DSM 6958]